MMCKNNKNKDNKRANNIIKTFKLIYYITQ